MMRVTKNSNEILGDRNKKASQIAMIILHIILSPRVFDKTAPGTLTGAAVVRGIAVRHYRVMPSSLRSEAQMPSCTQRVSG